MNKNKKSIRKSDYARVLITETLPHETPIIFSNDGVYSSLAEISLTKDPVKSFLINELVLGLNSKKSHSTIPLLYKVRKDSDELRRLALVHPRAQWKIKEFYEKYENLILYYCSRSPASIRAPNKVAGSYFIKNSMENLNQYKEGAIALIDTEGLVKHSPTFFAYRGYNRLYKFFEDKEYFELEKKYCLMLSLDVSKCFDSIYTHTLSWAVKDKEFTKANVSVNTTFAQQFDALMRFANHNETNGIVIGPEVSRLFSEIIFQVVDINTIDSLKSQNLNYEVEYCFRRYVDDVFIFADSEEIANLVYKTYSDCLLAFNLHSNISKKRLYSRPFVTSKSELIHQASNSANEFFEKFFDITDDFSVIKPKRIKSTWKLTRSYIDSIKTMCASTKVNYDQISAYVISIIAERIKRLVAINKIDNEDEVKLDYLNAIYVLIDTLFFMYEVSPSVSSSYKMSTSIILISRFVTRHLPTIEASVKQRIYELAEALIKKKKDKYEKPKGFIHLEVINIMLAIRELGDDYLLDEETIKNIFLDSKRRYFHIISFLYYIKNLKQYDSVKQDIVEATSNIMADLSDIAMDAEKAYLLLDLIHCPYIDSKFRKELIRRSYTALGHSQPSNKEISDFFNDSSSFQIYWDDSVDLLTTLEKKELLQSY